MMLTSVRGPGRPEGGAKLETRLPPDDNLAWQTVSRRARDNVVGQFDDVYLDDKGKLMSGLDCDCPSRRLVLSSLWGISAAMALAVLTECTTLLAVQIQPGDLIVTDSQNLSRPGVIMDINPQTGVQTIIASGGNLVQPDAVCFDSNGNIIVSDYGYIDSGKIIRIDPVTGQQSVISSGGMLAFPTSIATDSAGNLIVAQEGQGQANGAILKIDPITGAPSLVADGQPLSVPTGLAIEPNGDYLVSNFSNPTIGSAILRVDSASGAQSVVSSGGHLNDGPHGIWLSNLQSHRLLVAEFSYSNPANNAVLNINTLTGAQSVVSSGNLLMNPAGITQNNSGNIYVANFGSGDILAIDPLTGAQTVVSSGGLLESPLGIAVVVPEPGSFALAALGFAALAAYRQRRDSERKSSPPRRPTGE
jgi:sugar lactone lactonase YvrE